VRRHLEPATQAVRFDALPAGTQMVSDANPAFVPNQIRLVEKDRPILAAAIAASVDYLATGDKNHFGHLDGKTASGIRIIGPAEFLDLYEDRLIP